MVYAQIERLKKDSNELDIYARKLLKRGHESRAQKILQKRDFIQKHLSQMIEKPEAANSS
jgi:hypothetical protein